MAEHRTVLDPTVLVRLAASMDHIAQAWQRDVEDLSKANAHVGDLDRTINRLTDRADHLEADLATARSRIETLIERNAFLEAQVQRLRDTSLDARDSLTAIASQAEMVARDEAIDRPATRPAPLSPQPTTANRGLSLADVRRLGDDGNEDDGTGLPRGTPEFLRTPLPEKVEFARAAE